MWNKFIIGYCKVDFLCVNNDPNWLDWAIIIFVGLSFLVIVGTSLTSAKY